MASETKKRVLLLQPMVGIGDMVWHKPWLDRFIARHEIVLMAKPSAQAAAVLAEHQGKVEMTPLYRAERGRKGRHDGFIGFFRMVAAMRAAKADEIWILHRSWRYGAAAKLAGIPVRSGYGLGRQEMFLTDERVLSRNLKGSHPRDAVSAFAEARGLAPEDTHPRINLSPAEIKAAAALMPSGRQLVILGVGAADAIRRWAPEKFAELLMLLQQSHPQYRFGLCGSPAEAPLGEAVLAALDASVEPPLLIFDQPVRMVMALHQQASLYIGNDTSLINIAVAVGTPAVRIFASTLPVLPSPLIETVLPEDRARLDIPGSINDIPASAVAKLARAQLDALLNDRA